MFIKDGRLISNLYMGQKVKVKCNENERGSVYLGKGVRQSC